MYFKSKYLKLFIKKNFFYKFAADDYISFTPKREYTASVEKWLQ
jgi:hypothetical protein